MENILFPIELTLTSWFTWYGRPIGLKEKDWTSFSPKPLNNKKLKLGRLSTPHAVYGGDNDDVIGEVVFQP